MEFESVRDIIVETLGCEAEQVTLEASLADDLGADSLAAVELVMALEEASGITIADADVEGLKTVGDIVRYLEAHKA
ncbi:acyl carrier protein [uncultured Oscillibacter sp.]|uniref:acyl carrier protein n=1 Tax=uncultured Oscillibacter sp. TaxID=876091 RepID=UPI0025D3960C|nr:acyl carrier protein [uncultured Oscillibacter sp.]